MDLTRVMSAVEAFLLFANLKEVIVILSQIRNGGVNLTHGREHYFYAWLAVR